MFFDFACVSKVSKDGGKVGKFFRIVCVKMVITQRNLFVYTLNKYKTIDCMSVQVIQCIACYRYTQHIKQRIRCFTLTVRVQCYKVERYINVRCANEKNE